MTETHPCSLLSAERTTLPNHTLSDLIAVLWAYKARQNEERIRLGQAWGKVIGLLPGRGEIILTQIP